MVISDCLDQNVLYVNEFNVVTSKRRTFFMKKFSPKSNVNSSGQIVCKVVKSLHVPRAN